MVVCGIRCPSEAITIKILISAENWVIRGILSVEASTRNRKCHSSRLRAATLCVCV